MIVEVKPIDKERWHGRSGADSFTRDQTTRAVIHQGRYNVLLDDKRRKELEKLTRLDLSLEILPDDKPHPTWDAAIMKVNLPNATAFFDTSNPLDEIKVAIMRGSPEVANSFKEWEDQLWPDATHYIFSEEEEVEVKMRKIDKINEANRLALDMPLNQKADIIYILLQSDVKSKPTGYADVLIRQLIDEQLEDFIALAKQDKDRVITHALLERAVGSRLVTKEGPKYLWGTDVIGYDTDEAVDYLLKPENQPILSRIQERVNK